LQIKLALHRLKFQAGPAAKSKFDELYRVAMRRSPFLISGAPGGVRTPDLVLRRHTLYPSELRAHSESIGVEPLYYVLFRLTMRLGDRSDSACFPIACR